MLSLEKCRKIEPELKNLSDEEAIEIIENLSEMAQLAWESFLREKNGSKNP